MKRYVLISFTLFMITICLGITSCKKEQPQTLFSNILGNWRKTASATDDNGSGIITSSEIYPEPTGSTEILAFNADSTGYDSTVVNNTHPPTLTFKWYIIGDSVTLEYAAHQTYTYYIDNINSKDLTLYENTANGLVAFYYNK